MASESIQEINVKYMDGDPRAARAWRFADTIISVLYDFLPRDRACLDAVKRELVELGYHNDAEIVNGAEHAALKRAVLECGQSCLTPMFVDTNVSGDASTTGVVDD